eukprot:s9611_g1.t1
MVLFQLVLAQLRRDVDSASPQIALPDGLAHAPACASEKQAECLAEPTAQPDYAQLQHMARVAKTHCLICGEQVQDIQEWRRHIKAKHEAQCQMVDELGQSSTLLAANLTRLCPWCNVYFQKSAKEYRKKCLPLLQLSLRQSQTQTPLEPEQQLAAVWGLSSPLAGTPTPARQGNAARARTNPELPSKFRKDLGKGTHKSSQAKRSQEQEAEEEFLDGPGSTRRGDDQKTHPTSSSQAASRHEQQLTSLEADRSYVFFLEVGHHGLIGIGPSQPGLAPALRSRHRDDVSTGDTMGCPPSRVEDPTRQDRNDVNALQTAETAHWITRTPLQWTYTEWNVEQKKALPAFSVNSILFSASVFRRFPRMLENFAWRRLLWKMFMRLSMK